MTGLRLMSIFNWGSFLLVQVLAWIAVGVTGEYPIVYTITAHVMLTTMGSLGFYCGLRTASDNRKAVREELQAWKESRR